MFLTDNIRQEQVFCLNITKMINFLFFKNPKNYSLIN